MTITSSAKIYQVSELNQLARQLLETRLHNIQIEGEIANLARPASGHLYFTLKDANAQIRCAMFRNRNFSLKFKPDNGCSVIATGKVSLYEPRGDYQLIVDQLQPAGAGALQQAFDALKARLFAEGLFDDSHKKPLPLFPKRLGVITSPSGAAIRDVLNVLKRRYPLLEVIIYPVPVQGDDSAQAIVNAIGIADEQKDCDVLLLTRGSGSIEDLWSFNDEQLARAIHTCSLPLISGVGHEIDFTISDLVADVRAPTPSAAAELITPDQTSINQQLTLSLRKLLQLFRQKQHTWQQRIDWIQRTMQQLHPAERIRNRHQHIQSLQQRIFNRQAGQIHQQRIRLNRLQHQLDKNSPANQLPYLSTKLQTLHRRLYQQWETHFHQAAHSLESSASKLQVLNPQATLNRGYSIIFNAKTQQVVHSSIDISTGETIHARLADGNLEAKVTQTENK